MIKAEVISHEGNPGPNWLDHCRTAATPVNITVVLLLLVIGGLFIGITQKDSAETANQQSTSSTGQASVQPANTSLEVQPLQQETTTSNGNTSVQSATGGEKPVSNSTAQDASSDALGAVKTPALNNSNTPHQNKQSPSNSQPLRNLQGQLQSTVQSTTHTVNSDLSGLINH